MTALQATDRTVAELALRNLDVRALGRKLALPALLGAGVGFALLAGGHAHAIVADVERGLRVQPAWAALAVVLECLSLAGYVALLALVAGRATSRIGARESAQITLGGTAATRLLPTAGAGGLGLTVWALRRAGLSAQSATKTLLTFLVMLYSVFLAALVLAGGALSLGLVRTHGPRELGAVPALVALGVITLCAVLAVRRANGSHAGSPVRGGRVGNAALMLGEAVHEAVTLIRDGEARVAGAVAYWSFDAAVLWAMLHALGSRPALPVVVLAYFGGQLANTLPVPGSVSGGIAGVLIAFGVPVELAVPAVLAYRAISVWLPVPLAIASVPALRATVARWGSSNDADVGSPRERSGARPHDERKPVRHNADDHLSTESVLRASHGGPVGNSLTRAPRARCSRGGQARPPRAKPHRSAALAALMCASAGGVPARLASSLPQ